MMWIYVNVVMNACLSGKCFACRCVCVCASLCVGVGVCASLFCVCVCMCAHVSFGVCVCTHWGLLLEHATVQLEYDDRLIPKHNPCSPFHNPLLHNKVPYVFHVRSPSLHKGC